MAAPGMKGHAMRPHAAAIWRYSNGQEGRAAPGMDERAILLRQEAILKFFNGLGVMVVLGMTGLAPRLLAVAI